MGTEHLCTLEEEGGEGRGKGREGLVGGNGKRRAEQTHQTHCHTGKRRVIH
jgi:hypothetical protein